MKVNRLNIDRREFLQLSSKLAIFSIVAPYQDVLPQLKTNDNELKHQLLRDIQIYFQDKINFTANNFYKNFAKNNTPSYYLYISESDSIKKALNFPKYLYYGNSLNKGIKMKENLDSLGYHTLLYRTVGTMLTLLTDRLLSYSMESISFIAFHELSHIYIKQNSRIPYAIEEATCDIIANYESLSFSDHYRSLDTEKVSFQIKTIEEIKKTINRFYLQVGSYKNVSDLYKMCENEVFNLIPGDSLFLQDRYEYPVNNAYFLRIKSYSYHYFTLKKVFDRINNTKEFLNFIIKLPENYDDALSKIQQISK